MKYIQRPIEFEAVQYDGTSETYRSILKDVDKYQGRVKKHIDATIFVRCFNGALKVAKNSDYVMRLPDNTLNVMNSYDFEREYMPSNLSSYLSECEGYNNNDPNILFE